MPQKRRSTTKNTTMAPPSTKENPRISEDLMASIDMLSASLQEFRHDAEKSDAILNSTMLDRSKNRDAKGEKLKS